MAEVVITRNISSLMSSLRINDPLVVGSTTHALEIVFTDLTEIKGTINLHWVRGDADVLDVLATILDNKISYVLNDDLYTVPGLVCHIQFIDGGQTVEGPVLYFTKISALPTGTPIVDLPHYPVGDNLPMGDVGGYFAGDDKLGTQMQSIGARLAQIANVKTYGAIGDGVTDDSAAIQAAIAAIPKTGGVLFFPRGTYLHGDGVSTGLSYDTEVLGGSTIPLRTQITDIGRDIRFLFDGFENLRIEGNNSAIVSHESNGQTRNNAIFHFNNCDNVQIYDLELDGNMETRHPTISDYDDGTGKNLRGNVIIISCRNFYLKNVYSHHSMMDGFFSFAYDQDLSFNHIYEDCEGHYNFRQGLTLSSTSHSEVIRGAYSYNGTIYGQLPKSGIDIEADADFARDIKILDVEFKDNESNNLILSFRSEEIIVDGCNFYNSSVLMESDLNHGNIIKNCIFHDTNLAMAQNDFKIIDNVFIYTLPDPYFRIDCYNVTYQNEGGYPEFVGNKILCELPASIDMGAIINYGLVRLQNDRLIIRDNSFVDLYSTQTAGLPYVLTLVGKVMDNNLLKYDGVLSLAGTQFNIWHSLGGILDNTRVDGYESIYVPDDEWLAITMGASSTGDVMGRLKDGLVALKGGLIFTSTAVPIFTFPANLRPSKALSFMGIADDLTSHVFVTYIDSGQVFGPSAVNKNISFNASVFVLE